MHRIQIEVLVQVMFFNIFISTQNVDFAQSTCDSEGPKEMSARKLYVTDKRHAFVILKLYMSTKIGWVVKVLAGGS
jgi:hypothetical protein